MNEQTGETSAVTVILGATGGIGRALVDRLSRSGARLVLAARHEQPLRELADSVDGLAVPTDGTDSDSVDVLFKRAADEYGRVAGVVNLVGSVLLKPAHLLSNEDWDEAVRLNLNSAMYVVRAAVKTMMKGGGSIVLTSSVAATIGLINHDAIGAVKAGVEGLVRSSAASYAPRGIRINAVAPGLTRTNMTKNIFAHESNLNASVAMHPLKKTGEPEDVASAIAWLLQPDQRWVTGQVLNVDGGLSRVRARGGA